MSGNQRWREQFIAEATRANISLDDARLILRHAATLNRLAEAQCNGDWPCDNGERPVVACDRCEGLVVRSNLDKRRICQECRVQDRVRAIVATYGEGYGVRFSGDPRGCVVVILRPTDRRGEQYSDGIGVPA